VTVGAARWRHSRRRIPPRWRRSERLPRSLRRLLDLDFDLMVEGHRRVVREDPRLIMAAKLRFLTRLARRAHAARDRGLSVNRAVAEAFPWQQRPSWDRLFTDELARVTSCGEFCRHKLVKSFLDPATAGPGST
jgi:hypothetical protein